jgi:NAD-dependent dihydropyrimidine dehydrogenase PreA subunit
MARTVLLNEEGSRMYQVDVDRCSVFETCIDVRPTEDISMVGDQAAIDVDERVECGSCAAECLEEAILEVD